MHAPSRPADHLPTRGGAAAAQPAPARPNRLRTLGILTTLGLLATLAAVQAACGRGAAARGADAVHGRYLVEQVALCIDCHSPRDESGAFVPERWLQGGPLAFAPTVPMPWAPVAKNIANLPTLTDEQAVTFLTTGVLPLGRRALPPMPEYRFSAADARDVVAYLRQPVAPPPVTH